MSKCLNLDTNAVTCSLSLLLPSSSSSDKYLLSAYCVSVAVLRFGIQVLLLFTFSLCVSLSFSHLSSLSLSLLLPLQTDFPCATEKMAIRGH